MHEPLVIHKRAVSSPNQTLCEQPGAKIYLSSRVTCVECLTRLEVPK